MDAPLDSQILDLLPHQVAVLGKQGEIKRVNREWRSFAAQKGGNKSLLGSSYFERCCAASQEGLRRVLKGEVQRFEFEYPSYGDAQQWFLMQAVQFQEGALVSHIDITKSKMNEIAMHRLAVKDPLTGVYNRRGFDEILIKEQSRAQRSGEKHFALVLDCDDFKTINETYGHAGGDIVLCSVAQNLREVLRASDHIARIGGDEFVAMLINTDAESAHLIANRLLEFQAANTMYINQESARVTLSAGLIEVHENDRLENILERSFTPLRQAKDSGKNRVLHLEQAA